MKPRTQIEIALGIALGGLALLLHAQPAPPSAPQACAGGVTVLLNGQPLSTGCVLNILAGTGIIATPQSDPAINGTDLSFAMNTALIPTHDTVHANENFCNSTNGTLGYTCSLPNKALTAYAAGQAFLLLVDTACAASCSLNINSVGIRAIKLKDGVTDPGGALTAGQAQWVWFDGTVFRLM